MIYKSIDREDWRDNIIKTMGEEKSGQGKMQYLFDCIKLKNCFFFSCFSFWKLNWNICMYNTKKLIMIICCCN